MRVYFQICNLLFFFSKLTKSLGQLILSKQTMVPCFFQLQGPRMSESKQDDQEFGGGSLSKVSVMLGTLCLSRLPCRRCQSP